ncbi:sulfatase family protein [Rubinisphaera margarita]|uniref:sulfatase family protein n=1 Tax=Rubinisphaera margarita TaxID=2909586 RepID=UPI001EE98F67|nr:sulfatase [Rubinisphaera margarita]MCG6156036.1 sulfatase [Rubinisphaera margarita]
MQTGIRLALLLIAFVVTSTRVDAAERPNILFLFADDWGRYAGKYAEIDGPGTLNDVVKTPNIDRVAGEGVTFTNAYVNAPSCTPCRSSLLSGQYFYRTGQGAILQGAIWDSEIPTYPLLLQDNGYHIGFTYKVWSPGQPVNAGYGGRQNASTPAGGKFNGFSQQATRMVDSGKSIEEAKQVLLDEVRKNFESFLEKGDEGQSFCYWFGPTNVHRKWIAGSGKKLWRIDPDTLKGKVPPFLPDVPVVREDLADYFGEVAAFDAAVGVILESLQKRGQTENTLIVISGDHGAPGFPYGKCNLYDFGTNVPLVASWPGKIPAGRVVTDFTTLMDLAPTFLEAGGTEVPDVMTGRSLLPVMMSNKSGRVDEERDSAITGRERHVAEAREGQKTYPQRAIRTDEFLYIINFKPDRWPMGDPREVGPNKTPSTDALTNNTFIAFPDMDASPTKAWLVNNRNKEGVKLLYDFAFAKRPREELYVLADDPHQIRNVADQPQYEDVRKQLHDRLMKELRRTSDPRVVDSGETFENPPFTGPVSRN